METSFISTRIIHGCNMIATVCSINAKCIVPFTKYNRCNMFGVGNTGKAQARNCSNLIGNGCKDSGCIEISFNYCNGCCSVFPIIGIISGWRIKFHIDDCGSLVNRENIGHLIRSIIGSVCHIKCILNIIVIC